MAATQARRAPYKDTLQPALHRRFSSTATLLLGVAYLEAVVLATWSSYLWPWFPLGPAGIRTILIFSCGLAILILRIAHYHVGLKTTETGLQTLSMSLLSLRTYETAFWYCVSSLLFSPIYLGSTKDSANLSWITYFSGDRARLNERPLFLACYLATCALLQTITHYRVDIDRLDIASSTKMGNAQQKKSKFLSSSFEGVLTKLPAAFAGSIKQSISALPLTLIFYYLFLRSLAWSWTLMFMRPFYNLPRTSMLPPTWPSDIYLLSHCVFAGSFLNFLWAAGNTSFSVFMVKQPLKNGVPLTSESKDPNGSLLNGLKSKKLSIQAFAMWELALIAQDFDNRRQAIFADIDRKDGPAWSQIYAICMDVLKSIEARVDAYGKPAATVAPQSTQTEERQRISAPLKEDPIFSSQSSSKSLRNGVETAWDQFARSPGSTPASELSPMAKKTWQNAKDRVLSKEQQEAMSPDHLKGQARQWVTDLMGIGWVRDLFQHDFRTQFAAVVLGTPYAEPTLYSHAVLALCELASHSLVEDQYGNVHRDVPGIVRALTTVITKIEALKRQFPLHWTDTKGLRDAPEVELLLDALRTGLGHVVSKFEPYSTDLRLSLADLRFAKEAITPPQQQAKAPPKEAKPAPAKERVIKARPAEERGAQRRSQRREQRGSEMEQVR